MKIKFIRWEKIHRYGHNVLRIYIRGTSRDNQQLYICPPTKDPDGPLEIHSNAINSRKPGHKTDPALRVERGIDYYEVVRALKDKGFSKKSTFKDVLENGLKR